MQVIKPMALGISSRCLEFKRRLGLYITASVYFPFRPAGEGTCWTDMSMWKFLGAEMAEGPMIDEGVVKQRSEFLVHGSAYAPGGSAQAVEVVARVGSRQKVLHAVGRRRWNGRQATAPEPFASLPLDWRHAYGGPGFAPNPLGMGRAAPDAPGQEQWLPQVVMPSVHPEHPEHDIAPAGLRALDCSWPQRARHAGTYDEAWMREQMPGLANDIDWRYFNLAPEDQWFDSPPRGDEAYEFVHMHPTKPKVGGVLPGLRARAFADHGDGKMPKLREVPLRLTTLWFFPHAERGIALFQGLAECNEDDASDIHTLLAAIERLDEPRKPEHYLDALQRRRDPKKGALQSMREGDLVPAGLMGQDPEFEAQLADHKPDGLAGQAQRRGAEFRASLAIDQARALGQDPVKLGLALPKPEPVPTLENLPDYLEKKEAEIVNAQVNAMLDAVERRNAALETAVKAGIDPQSLVPRGPPKYKADAHLAELQALAAGSQNPPPFDAGKLAPQLRQVEANARSNYLAGAHEQAPAAPLPPERAQPLRSLVAQAHAEGKSFLGADLTGADLSGMDLRGADFTGAWLESANLSGAKLDGAGFAFAVLAHADLSAADARQCDFFGANLGRAKLTTARLVQATLSNAVLSHTDLAQTDLRGARLDGAKLDSTTYGLADWRSVQGQGLVFIKADLKKMVMTHCQLARPTFIDCDLSGVDFSQARLERPTFVKCKGVATKFNGAALEGAVFVDGCDFSQADFKDARMKGSNLRGATLVQARFAGAVLDDSDLSDCNATGADFDGATLRNALLIKARLGQAKLTGTNLMNAIVQRADLRGADLRDSNLYGSDLSRVWLDAGSLLLGANADRAKTYPRREAPAA